MVGETGQNVYLTVNHTDDDEDVIDLANVFSNIWKKKRLYGYIAILAVFAGLVVGIVIYGVQCLTGNSSYSRAVITFSYEGIDEGLDPNGAAFDINKLKSPVVIQAALDNLGGGYIG